MRQFRKNLRGNEDGQGVREADAGSCRRVDVGVDCCGERPD